MSSGIIGGERGHSAMTQMQQPRETRAVAPVAPSTDAEPSGFAKVLARAGNEFAKIEARAEHAKSAALTASPGEILVLQADMNRYTEILSISAKVVESATNAAKTVLGKSDG